MEKHWRSVVGRTVCDFFFEAQEKVSYKRSFIFIDSLSQATSPNDVPPVIPTPHYYLVNIFRCDLYFVAVIQNEGKHIYMLTMRALHPSFTRSSSVICNRVSPSSSGYIHGLLWRV